MSKVLFILISLFFILHADAQKIKKDKEIDKYLNKVLQEHKVKAVNGDIKSMHIVGVQCYRGKFYEKDQELGMKYIKRAEENNYAPTLKFLGDIAFENKEYLQSLAYYKKAIIYYKSEDSIQIDYNDIISQMWSASLEDIQIAEEDNIVDIIVSRMLVSNHVAETFEFLSKYDTTSYVIYMIYKETLLNKNVYITNQP